MSLVFTHVRQVFAVGLISVAILEFSTVGCTGRGAAEADAAVSHVRAEYDQMGKLTRLNYDRNKNNRTDTVAFMDGTRIVRIEIDSDENGLVDRWEYYAHQQLDKVGFSTANDGIVDTWAYRDPAGQIQRIEISTARNGKVNRTEFYKDSALIAAEEYSGADGQLDKWESYSQGTLTIVAFDTSGRGKPDRRIVYGKEGALDRIEVDPDGDGTFERLTESR